MGECMSRWGNIIERFWGRVNVAAADECWEWTGSTNAYGYGYLRIGGTTRSIGAHRLSAKIAYGMFDERLLVLHHCDNPPCVNPAHLYVGTPKQNTQDAVRRGRARNQHVGKTHCINGHELAGDNVAFGKRGDRQCRACAKARRDAAKADPVVAAQRKAKAKARQDAAYFREYRAKRRAEGRVVGAK